MARRRELAVRLSLGASARAQLVRQLLVESIMLSSSARRRALVIAAWGSRALVAHALDADADRRRSTSRWTGACSRSRPASASLTGLLFGVVPALRGTAVTPADALRDHSRGIVSGGGRLNVGHGLVALQVALSFVLVFGSTLFVRTLVGLTTPGDGLRVAARAARARSIFAAPALTPSQRLALFERIRDAVAAVPGVEAAAARS